MSLRKNPKGEVHEEWRLISYGRARNIYVCRKFHLEGFVNQYVIADIAENGKTIRFVTETIENFSPGWRARESYKILGSNEFIEVFELATPDKEFELCSEDRFQRVHSE